jgi:hypothetical protein
MGVKLINKDKFVFIYFNFMISNIRAVILISILCDYCNQNFQILSGAAKWATKVCVVTFMPTVYFASNNNSVKERHEELYLLASLLIFKELKKMVNSK